MQRGHIFPVILIFVLFIAVSFATIAVYISKNKSSSVKGVQTIFSEVSNGFSVKISSAGGTWDLYEYMCSSLDECVSSLTAGKWWGVVSGGEVKGHEVLVEATPEWGDYNYIKIFTKPAWGSGLRSFYFEHGYIQDKNIVKIKDSGQEYDTLIIPLNEVAKGFTFLGEFTDRSK